ncbi:MAG: type II 3-dehydroquinate dehydratase [Ferruginibacter sp.]
MKIAIINGPNLNLLGKREPEVYGTETFESYLDKLKTIFPNIEFTYFQSNVEGELVTALQKVGFSADGIILNPGAYTHTSIAIGDAVTAITTKVVEVHISNIFAREEFRKHSYVSAKCVGVISGLGLKGYQLGVHYLSV